MIIQVGTILYGYCGGYFGGDSYKDKRVEALGADWIVCRDSNGNIHFACGKNILGDLTEYMMPKEEFGWPS